MAKARRPTRDTPSCSCSRFIACIAFDVRCAYHFDYSYAANKNAEGIAQGVVQARTCTNASAGVGTAISRALQWSGKMPSVAHVKLRSTVGVKQSPWRWYWTNMKFVAHANVAVTVALLAPELVETLQLAMLQKLLAGQLLLFTEGLWQ